MKKEITTPDADSVPGILSQAVDTGNLVFVSGYSCGGTAND